MAVGFHGLFPTAVSRFAFCLLLLLCKVRLSKTAASTRALVLKPCLHFFCRIWHNDFGGAAFFCWMAKMFAGAVLKSDLKSDDFDDVDGR